MTILILPLPPQLKKSEDQINDLRAQLEEANVRTAIADSKLNEIESKHAQQLREYNNLVSYTSNTVSLEILVVHLIWQFGD